MQSDDATAPCRQACCKTCPGCCAPPPPPEPPPPPAVCADVEGWADNTGDDCAAYVSKGWCCGDELPDCAAGVESSDAARCCDSKNYAQATGPFKGMGSRKACCASCHGHGPVQVCDSERTSLESSAGTLRYRWVSRTANAANASASGSCAGAAAAGTADAGGCIKVIQAAPYSHVVLTLNFLDGKDPGASPPTMAHPGTPRAPWDSPGAPSPPNPRTLPTCHHRHAASHRKGRALRHARLGRAARLRGAPCPGQGWRVGRRSSTSRACSRAVRPPPPAFSRPRSPFSVQRSPSHARGPHLHHAAPRRAAPRRAAPLNAER